jgi:hypothetical protein
MNIQTQRKQEHLQSLLDDVASSAIAVAEGASEEYAQDQIVRAACLLPRAKELAEDIAEAAEAVATLAREQLWDVTRQAEAAEAAWHGARGHLAPSALEDEQ